MSLIKALDDWATESNLGPQQKKLVERIKTEVKSEEDAGVINNAFDRIIELVTGKGPEGK